MYTVPNRCRQQLQKSNPKNGRRAPDLFVLSMVCSKRAKQRESSERCQIIFLTSNLLHISLDIINSAVSSKSTFLVIVGGQENNRCRCDEHHHVLSQV